MRIGGGQGPEAIELSVDLASELGIGGGGGEAIIADEVPDHGTVLLLDMKNVATAKEVLRRAIPLVPESCEHGCPEALRSSVITDPSAFPPRARKKLALLLDRHFPVKTGARPRG